VCVLCVCECVCVCVCLCLCVFVYEQAETSLLKEELYREQQSHTLFQVRVLQCVAVCCSVLQCDAV